MVIGFICMAFAQTIALNLGTILGLILLIGAVLSFINFFVTKPYLVGMYGGLFQSFGVLVASVLCFIFAEQAFTLITVVVGIIAVVSGFTNFLVAIINAWMKEHCLWDILDAVAQTILGILLFTNAQGLIETIILLFGLYILLKGLVQLCIVLYKQAKLQKQAIKQDDALLEVDDFTVYMENDEKKDEK